MNVFAYRLPGKAEVQAFCSETAITGLAEGCFVVAPFDGAAEETLSIPAERRINLEDSAQLIRESLVRDRALRCHPFPARSVSESEHGMLVQKIVKEIKEGNLCKCVAARAERKEGVIDIRASFEALCQAYPNAFVFLFHTPLSGAWMGASPELLGRRRGRGIESMSLAGTREAGSDEAWGVKNLEEHKIVTQYIVDAFDRNGVEAICEGPVTYAAGPVEHLMTRISGEANSPETAGRVVRELSPTPALCGFPPKSAKRFIRMSESFDRGYYGGYCGPVRAGGDFDLFVNLRSMTIEENSYCLIAGGGIMAESEPEKEWAETVSKASTLLKLLKLQK